MNSVAGYENMYRSSGCQADLSVPSNTSQSEWEGVQWDHGLALHSSLSTEGAVVSKKKMWGGTSVCSRFWPKSMLWLQYLYLCFDVDLIKTSPFTKDWGFK